jgi:hypothetical protein
MQLEELRQQLEELRQLMETQLPVIIEAAKAGFKPKVEAICNPESTELRVLVYTKPYPSVDHDTTLPLYVSGFNLSVLPGNSQILISHNVYVNWMLRRSGWGKLLCNARLELAKKAGFHGLIATVAHDNEAEHRVLGSTWTLAGPITPTADLWMKQL